MGKKRHHNADKDQSVQGSSPHHRVNSRISKKGDLDLPLFKKGRSLVKKREIQEFNASTGILRVCIFIKNKYNIVSDKGVLSP